MSRENLTFSDKEEFEFENSISGARKFHQIIQTTAKEMDAQKIIIGAEVTSHYYENMTHQLNGLGYNITLINPYSVWCQRQGQLNWCKTDSIDLCAIGQTLIDKSRIRDSVFFWSLLQSKTSCKNQAR